MNDSAHATSVLAVHTRGKGPPLVLYHGGMGSWNHWTRNLDALARRFTVYAVDLPGYGGSPTVSKAFAHDAYIDRVLEVFG